MEEFLPQLLAFPPNPLPPRGLSNGEIDRQLIAQIQLISQINESKLIEGITGDADLLDVKKLQITVFSRISKLICMTGSWSFYKHHPLPLHAIGTHKARSE